MAPKTKKGIPSLKDFPKPLRMAIAKVMARFDLDYPEALERAAQLIDINSPIFKEKVKSEADRRYKSVFMTGINNARATIERNVQARIDSAHRNGYDEGYNKAKSDYGVWYNCAVCNEPIYLKPYSEPHRIVSESLRSRGWGHTSCHQNRASG